MNPHIVLRSVRNYIRLYEADLVADLESGGTAKVIGQVTTSRHTRPKQRIFVWLTIPNMVEYYDGTELGSAIAYSHVVTQQAHNEYDMEMHVADYALQQAGENPGEDYELFERDAETFWTFVSRLVRLFRQYTSIPSSTGTFKIEVYGDGSEEDRRIRIRDLSGYVAGEAGSTHAALYAIIYFRVGTCAEPNPLS